VGSPGWLAVGTALRDPDGERWRVRSTGATTVRVQHPERGVHRLRREDLVAWVEAGDWTVETEP